MSALVSVIIPTYNRHGELGELLESLSLQTYADFEVIVVNDNGDPVEPLCARYDDLHIRIVNMAANVKHVHARNRGVEEARGEYVLLCDDDDLLLPTHIENMVLSLEQGYDLVYSDVEIVEFVWEDGLRRPVSRRVFAYDHDPEAMRRFSTFVPSGALYRKAIHDRLGPFDTEVYHYWDWDFFLRVMEGHRVAKVAAATVLYAFAAAGSSNLSGQLENMRPYLDLLSAKHGLGELPTKNFFLLLEEPDVKSREAATEVVWDGIPFRSRLRS